MKGDKTGDLLKLIKRNPQPTFTVDQLLVAHYRSTGEALKRSVLVGRLYSLLRQKKVVKLPKCKGIFALSHTPTEVEPHDH